VDCSRRVRIGTKPGICVATGRFEVAKNRELRGEERAMAVPEGKSNRSENHHSRDGVGKSNGGEGVEKIWSWRINSEDEDEPSKSPHRQRCLRTGSTVAWLGVLL
jgi:hypothetical protein